MSTFPLMWRNVYAMPSGFDAQKFRLRMVLVRDTSKSQGSSGRFFSEILGLTNHHGRPAYDQQPDLRRRPLAHHPARASSRRAKTGWALSRFPTTPSATATRTAPFTI